MNARVITQHKACNTDLIWLSQPMSNSSQSCRVRLRVFVVGWVVTASLLPFCVLAACDSCLWVSGDYRFTGLSPVLFFLLRTTTASGSEPPYSSPPNRLSEEERVKACAYMLRYCWHFVSFSSAKVNLFFPVMLVCLVSYPLTISRSLRVSIFLLFHSLQWLQQIQFLSWARLLVSSTDAVQICSFLL